MKQVKPSLKLATRQVTPRFWENAELADLEIETGIRHLRLTMIGLWAVADEVGIFEWHPRRLAGKIYPYSAEDQQAVEPAMNAFVQAGFLKKIEVNGSWYGVWPHWGEHNKFRKNESRYPEVAAALGHSVEGEKTPDEGQNTPLEAELETELEVEVVGGSESKKEPTASGQEEELPPNDDVQALCNLISDYSGNSVKPDWAKYAQAILKITTLDKLKPLLEWMYVDSDFWGKRTFNTKNLFDHLQEGNLPKRYNAEKKLAKKRAEKQTDTKRAPGAHGNDSGMEF